MDIPNVGVFRIRNSTAAVSFNDYLMNDAKESSNNNKSLNEKLQKGEMKLTKENIRKFTDL
jgi:hypothetical protein